MKNGHRLHWLIFTLSHVAMLPLAAMQARSLFGNDPQLILACWPLFHPMFWLRHFLGFEHYGTFCRSIWFPKCPRSNSHMGWGLGNTKAISFSQWCWGEHLSRNPELNARCAPVRRPVGMSRSGFRNGRWPMAPPHRSIFSDTLSSSPSRLFLRRLVGFFLSRKLRPKPWHSPYLESVWLLYGWNPCTSLLEVAPDHCGGCGTVLPVNSMRRCLLFRKRRSIASHFCNRAILCRSVRVCAFKSLYGNKPSSFRTMRRTVLRFTFSSLAILFMKRWLL